MPFQFRVGPPKPQPEVPETEQPATPQQMPLAKVPEAPTAAETTEVLSVPQLTTPLHREDQSSTKRQASPGSVLSPVRPARRPHQLFKGYAASYRGETYDAHFADRSDFEEAADPSGASDNDRFFGFDGSDHDTGQPVATQIPLDGSSASSERVRPSPKPP